MHKKPPTPRNASTLDLSTFSPQIRTHRFLVLFLFQPRMCGSLFIPNRWMCSCLCKRASVSTFFWPQVRLFCTVFFPKQRGRADRAGKSKQTSLFIVKLWYQPHIPKIKGRFSGRDEEAHFHIWLVWESTHDKLEFHRTLYTQIY